MSFWEHHEPPLIMAMPETLTGGPTGPGIPLSPYRRGKDRGLD